mgnify:FL=1
MKDQFEIRLDFKSNTGSPERIFLAMAEYVSAFDNLVNVVSRGIDPDNEITCELSTVKMSPLKSVVDCTGGYCATLAQVPLMIANHMVGLNSISKEEQIDAFANKLEQDILSDTKLDFPNQANINRLALAKGLNQLANASKRLVEGETLDVKNSNGNVFSINTRTRFTKDPEDIFKEHIERKREVETLLVKKSVFVGSSMWEFKSIQRKKAFNAPIEDKAWLKKYQNRDIHLEPGDAISAMVEFVIYKEKGAKNYSFKDHKILDVALSIKNNELQHTLELETGVKASKH